MKEIVAQKDDLANKLAKMELELSKKNNELVEKTKEIAQAKRKHSYQIMEKDEKIANKNKIIEHFSQREEFLQLENAQKEFALAASMAKKDDIMDELINEKCDLVQENKEFREEIAQNQDEMVGTLKLIRENSELAQENQDLIEKIDESVKIAKENDVVFNELIRENWEHAQENQDLIEKIEEKDRLVLELAQENYEKDVVLDEVIRKNFEMVQENQDLIEEIDESVEIAQEKDVVVNELIRENWELAQENQDLIEKIDESLEIAQQKDVILDELIRKNWELSQVKVLEVREEVKDIVGEVEEVADKVEEVFDKVEELEIELKFELKIAKNEEDHTHKASFFLPTGTEMFQDEIILNQILVKNNLTSIGMTGKSKIIRPREDEERILYVEVTHDLALAIKSCKEVLLDVPCLDLGSFSFKPITIYTQIFDLYENVHIMYNANS